MLTLLETVKVLHIEPTDVCQAACPMCARETDPRFDKDTRNSLTVDDIKRILDISIIQRLDKMFLCGNYGDPAAGNAIEIFEYFKLINPTITLGMNTNGGLQSTPWWRSLARVLNQPKDYVVFSIDGLGDTNHIYRKNVNWDYTMRNAQAFIDAGGNAQWDMLVFEHNEHQVDACERLAKSLGFSWFRAKVSKRPSKVNWINPPKNWVDPVIISKTIDCHALNEQSVYLDAKGRLFPCCWQGYTANTLEHFENIKSSWATDTCDAVCSRTCGSAEQKSSFTNQWQRVTQF